MQKRQLTIVAGSIVAALVVGALVYAFYPNNFAPYSSTLGATNTTHAASTGDQQLYGGEEQTIAAGQSNSSANQNWTASFQDNKSSAVPRTEPRQPSDANGY